MHFIAFINKVHIHYRFIKNDSHPKIGQNSHKLSRETKALSSSFKFSEEGLIHKHYKLHTFMYFDINSYEIDFNLFSRIYL